MRRAVLILASMAALVALAAFGPFGASDPGYLVRGYFDNGGFIVTGEQVRIAGATVGTVDAVDVSMPGEAVHADGKPDPGKAVVVMKITDPGFQDFRRDASCIIRPQSLLGEKYIDCTPTAAARPGSPAPPPLTVIADGKPGAGQRFLPLENNGKQVDLDIVQNIFRLPYAQRFRLILNDLGAGLAARGSDLEAIVRRADPALRETDQVLAILAQQNHALAKLASDSETVLAPLARERAHVSGFIANAGVTAAATAERGAALQAGLQRFPRFLSQLRSTMVALHGFSDQAQPVFADLGAAAPSLTRVTKLLAPFSSAGETALTSLGDAASKSTGNLVAADSVVKDLRDLSRLSAQPSSDLQHLLGSLRKTGGFKRLLSFIYFGAGSVNGFDQYGHFLRSELVSSNCVDYDIAPFSGCGANFTFSGKAKSKSITGKPEAAPAERQAMRPGSAQQRPARSARRHRRGAGSPPADFPDRRPPARSARPRRPAGSAPAPGAARRRPPPAQPTRAEPPGPGRAEGGRQVRSRRSAFSTFASSPVLVGAITSLIAAVAVFLAYNANNGLPFVKTYRLSVQVSDAQSLVPGNEVRIAGVRVGAVESVEPVQEPSGAVHAKLDLKLEGQVDPLPVDSTVIVRAKSALGLKYLEIVKGSSSKGYAAGSTVPLSAAHPEPVDIDQLLNTFDTPTRIAIQENLTEFGTALGGRGVDLNQAIGELRPLLVRLQPVAANLSSPRTELAGFFRALEATAAEVAPVAETQAHLFVALDSTFGALAGVARPFIQETISETPPTLDVANRALPVITPFLNDSAALFADLQPGAEALRTSAPTIADALAKGVPALEQSPQLNVQLPPTAQSLADFSADAGVRAGIDEPDQKTNDDPGAAAELRHPGADGLQLRDAAVPKRGQRAQPRRRHRDLAALHSLRHAAGRQQRGLGGECACQRRRGGPGQLPPHQPLPEHRLARPAARVRGRQRELHRRPAGDRQRARQPGHATQGQLP